MRRIQTTLICIAALIATSHAWGGDHDDQESSLSFSRRQQGQIVFVGSNGKLQASPSLTFDDNEMAVQMDKFNANSFAGDTINFRGREIRNAALVDSTIEGLRHLTVDTLALRSQASTGKHGHGLAMIDGDGIVSTTGHLRWDETSKSLKVPSLTSFGESISIDSHVDFGFHTLLNAKLSPGTRLEELEFSNGRIENTVLDNVTLGDVTMDSLTISELNSKQAIGSMLVIGEDGSVESSPILKQGGEDNLLVNSKVSFKKPINLNMQAVTNAKITSGSIDGPIDISANYINTKGITIRDIQDDKSVTSNGLAVIGLDGKLTMGAVKVDQSQRHYGLFS
jgi:hypothetical protein